MLRLVLKWHQTYFPACSFSIVPMRVVGSIFAFNDVHVTCDIIKGKSISFVFSQWNSHCALGFFKCRSSFSPPSLIYSTLLLYKCVGYCTSCLSLLQPGCFRYLKKQIKLFLPEFFLVLFFPGGTHLHPSTRTPNSI